MKKLFRSKGITTKQAINKSHRDTNLISKQRRETIKDTKTAQALNAGSLRNYGYNFEEGRPRPGKQDEQDHYGYFRGIWGTMQNH